MTYYMRTSALLAALLMISVPAMAADVPALPEWNWEPAWTQERVREANAELDSERAQMIRSHRVRIEAFADALRKLSLKEDAQTFVKIKEMTEWVIQGQYRAENIAGYRNLLTRVASEEAFDLMISEMRKHEKALAQLERRRPQEQVIDRKDELVDYSNKLAAQIREHGQTGSPAVHDRDTMSQWIEWNVANDDKHKADLQVYRDRIREVLEAFDHLTTWANGVEKNYGAKSAAAIRNHWLTDVEKKLQADTRALSDHHRGFVASLPEGMVGLEGARSLGHAVDMDRRSNPEQWPEVMLRPYGRWQAALVEQDAHRYASWVEAANRGEGQLPAILPEIKQALLDILTTHGIAPEDWFPSYTTTMRSLEEVLTADALAEEEEALTFLLHPTGLVDEAEKHANLGKAERLHHVRLLSRLGQVKTLDDLTATCIAINESMSAHPQFWEGPAAAMRPIYSRVQTIKLMKIQNMNPLTPAQVTAILDQMIDPDERLVTHAKAAEKEQALEDQIGKPAEGALDPADPIEFVDAYKLEGAKRTHHAKLVAKLVNHTTLRQALDIRPAVEADMEANADMWDENLKAAYTQLQARQWRGYWLAKGKDRVRKVLNAHEEMKRTGFYKTYVDDFKTAAKAFTADEAEVSYRLICEGLLDEKVFAQWIGPQTFERYGPDPADPAIWKAVWEAVKPPTEAGQGSAPAK